MRTRRDEESLVPELAAAFCKILAEWLTPAQLNEAVVHNAIEATNGNTGVCHSHDHCDANQAMLNAWEELFGKNEAPAIITANTTQKEKDRDDLLWNRAWAFARTKRFKP